jgi:mono/diheme cytochrome c family protein
MKKLVLALAATSLAALTIGSVSSGFAATTARTAGTPQATTPQATSPQATMRQGAAPTSIERGRYVIATSGCNDCHTAGYAEAGGQMPTDQWLTGLPVGFTGPWGTSYPANLRLTVQSLTEEQWLTFARAERLPPMPWFNLKAMNDADLRAIYRFIRSLGVKGERAPAPVGPGLPAKTPVIVFVPQVLAAQLK